MAQSNKGASDVIQRKPRWRKELATPKSALSDIQKCKKLGIEMHLQANKMRSSYAGHVHWGRKCSDKALALFMSQKGFHENLSKNTVESICAAFKKLWEQADSSTFHGKWSFNEARQRWEGNPADSAEVLRTHQIAVQRHIARHNPAGYCCKKYLVHEPLTLSDSNTYFEIFLSNQKGWQKKVDKGICKADLSFIWMLLWIKWLEFFHYGRTLRPNNFIFPSMGANGIMQPGQPLSHDTVQSGLMRQQQVPSIGSCSHQLVSSGHLPWFDGGEDGLMVNSETCSFVTFFDELHTYETDYSDALAPFSCKAESSLAGEQALMRPASTEELCMVHHSVTADVNCLRVDISAVNNSLRSLTSMVQATSSCLKAAGHLPHLTMATQLKLKEYPRFNLLSKFASTGAVSPWHATHTGPGHTASTQQLPSNGLVIPRLPLVHLNGLKTPKAESWKDIITHWLVGDPNRGLKTPLKDWPQEWYQGLNWKLAMQYQNRAIVAHEFINHYQSDEALFLAAYPEAERGHTPLLAAINKARAVRGERGHMARTVGTVHSIPAPTLYPSPQGQTLTTKAMIWLEKGKDQEHVRPCETSG
ncbi:uncharacterized protein EDB93DRAFT_1108102 [Suillus bovinus]|uniref:uncharacterized protein n=1 Tax=Suillus bovinus TaxID=48563 RepID=UPI001B8609B6|nr:uncharacterized protein EDB93DRAFT_1108102 [Suillus bovinus]KAG2131401.1 hypothetical protein EDB93DRAFT_1108102 [Suillus bovinus]